MQLQRRKWSPFVWTACLLGTGCATMIHEAVQRDMYEYGKNQPEKSPAAAQEEDTDRICPPDKLQVEDCRVIPCKVTCEDPKKAKR